MDPQEENTHIAPSPGARLYKAAESGDIEGIEEALHGGADINCRRGAFAKTPLLAALGCLQEEAALALIHRGADIHIRALNSQRTALHFAARWGLTKAVAKLMEAGIDVAAKDEAGDSALEEAIQAGHRHVMGIFLARDGCRALITPSIFRDCIYRHGQESIARMLLEARPELAAVRYPDAFFPLQAALSRGFDSLAIDLLKLAPDAAMFKSEKGSNSLFFAVGPRPEPVRALLKLGVIVDERNLAGTTPLLTALKFGSSSVAVSLLVDGNADPNLRDVDGFTSFAVAVHHSASPRTLVALLEMGASAPALLEEYPHLENGLAWSVVGYLRPLFSDFRGPIRLHRRVLWWALNSPTVEELRYTSSFSKPANQAVESAKAALQAREKRLKPLKDDAWKRRRHLCIDRALWRKPATAAEEGGAATAGPGARASTKEE
jgi:ankyrin repeat protein